MIIDKKCISKRKVKQCEDCCRFLDCKTNQPHFFSNVKGCIELGYDIITCVSYYYKWAWKRGYTKVIESLTLWLQSPQPMTLTAELCNGIFVLESLERVCTEKYGTLESRHERLLRKISKSISELEIERKKTKSRKEKFDLTNKINELKGEENF